MNRRALLSTAFSGAAVLALAGCITTSTTGGTTNVTIDVSKVLTYAGTAVQVLSAALAIPGVPATIAALGLTAEVAAAVTVVDAAYAAVKAATIDNGGVFTLGVDTTSFQTLVSTLITSLNVILNLVAKVVTGVPATVLSDVQKALAALKTFIPFLSLAVSLAGATKTSAAPLSIDEATAVTVDLSLRYSQKLN